MVNEFGKLWSQRVFSTGIVSRRWISSFLSTHILRLHPLIRDSGQTREDQKGDKIPQNPPFPSDQKWDKQGGLTQGYGLMPFGDSFILYHFYNFMFGFGNWNNQEIDRYCCRYQAFLNGFDQIQNSFNHTFIVS